MDMLFKTEERGPLYVVVVLHTARNPSPLEWTEYIAELRRLKHLTSGELARVLNLVVSDGGAPDTAQRSTFQNDVFGGQPAQLALLTNSLSNPVKRGVAKALTWLNPGFRIFEPDDLNGALAYLKVAHLLDVLWLDLCAMQARLPPIGTLNDIAQRLGREPPGSIGLASDA